MLLVPHTDIVVNDKLPRRVAILGSTGSIGESTLSLAREFPEAITVVGLAASRSVDALVRQIHEFKPQVVSVADADAGKAVHAALSRDERSATEVIVGPGAECQVATDDRVDTVVAAIVGMAGLPSTVASIRAGKRLCLANKESLVCAGDLVRRELRSSKSLIIPVDSEHSALFQSLGAERVADVASLILTASGGPFLHTRREELVRVTPEEAVRHPRWNMGPKISVDSATMFNKALELIEAHYLFGISPETISVVVHPQSIVHSLVEFVDGTQIAELSVPDMRGPIAHALLYPHRRLPGVMKKLRLQELGSLDFLALDDQRFPAVSMARQVLQAGGDAPMRFNVANEVAVEAFLAGRIRFTEIADVVSAGLDYAAPSDYSSVEELVERADALRRELDSCGS